MIEVSRVASDDMSAWDAYVRQSAEASTYHQSLWRGVIERVFSRQTFYLQARANDDIVGLLPLVRLRSFAFGDFLVSLPYVTYGGVLADSEAVRDALMDNACELAAELGVKHVEFRHTAPVSSLPSRQDKISMMLELPTDSDTLFKSIGAKLRAQVRRPTKQGAVSEVGGLELIDDFYAVFAEKYKQLGVPVYPKRWFEEIVTAQPESTRVFLVRLEGRVVAASITLGHRKQLEVPYAATRREADRYSVNMLLYWSMLEYAIESGFAEFDFGRTTQGSGTHRFKKQWGAVPRQLHWHYWLAAGGDLPQLNASNPKYELAVKIWRRLPLWVTKWLGPKIVRNLP